MYLSLAVSVSLRASRVAGAQEVPGTNPARCPLSGPSLSFISLGSLHSTCCWPATSQLPFAFKVALDGDRWGAGRPGLPANSSLNSRLGMQGGPRAEPSAPWVHPGFTGELALAQEPRRGEHSLLLPSHGHCSGGCPLEREGEGRGGGFGGSISPLRGTLSPHAPAVWGRWGEGLPQSPGELGLRWHRRSPEAETGSQEELGGPG